jgi:uncharacterized protein YuzE
MIANKFINPITQSMTRNICSGFLSIFAKNQTLSLQATKPLKLKNMKIKYDKENDILYVRFLETKIAESDEQKPGIIMDYDADGNMVGLEVLNASEKIGTPGNVTYELA